MENFDGHAGKPTPEKPDFDVPALYRDMADPKNEAHLGGAAAQDKTLSFTDEHPDLTPMQSHMASINPEDVTGKVTIGGNMHGFEAGAHYCPFKAGVKGFLARAIFGPDIYRTPQEGGMYNADGSINYGEVNKLFSDKDSITKGDATKYLFSRTKNLVLDRLSNREFLGALQTAARGIVAKGQYGSAFDFVGPSITRDQYVGILNGNVIADAVEGGSRL